MMNKSKSANAEKLRYLLAMPLLVLMLGLFSWKMAENATNLTGTWIGSDFEFTLNEGPELKDMVEGGKSLHMDGKLILDQDKSYQIYDPRGTINGQGNWSLNGKILVMTDQEGNAVEYLIEEVTDTRLITVHQVSTDTPMGKVSGTIRLTYSKE